MSLILLLAPVAISCNQAASEAKPANNSERMIKVTVIKVEPTQIKDVLILPGETKPWQDVTLAANQAGTVEWIGPREGDQVKKGELLAKVDVSALKAALDNAQANLKLAEELYHRRLRLFERKIVSQEELDQSKTQWVVAQGSLRQTRVAFEHGFLHSPIDGVVNQRHLDPGEYVAQGGRLLDLVNVDKVQIDVNVPELDVRYLKPGQQALVRVDALPGQDFLGDIDFVAYKADAATKTFRIKVLVDNAAQAIRPGMIARVAFLRRIIPDALTAPLTALVDKGGERLLFVEKDGVAQARQVSLGVIDQDRIQITKGLMAGERLIVSGQTEVEEGTKVQVQ
ncbi:MAG: efflux RND transporter periplasmic adaptor subunit [Thermodesulfobacteriota bacterium]